MLFNISEFHENQCKKSHTFLMSLNEITFTHLYFDSKKSIGNVRALHLAIKAQFHQFKRLCKLALQFGVMNTSILIKG